MTSLVRVLPGDCSPLALKNKPAVPVGYHTPRRSAETEPNIYIHTPSVCEGDTTTTVFTVFNRQQRLGPAEHDKERKQKHTHTHTHTKCDGLF